MSGDKENHGIDNKDIYADKNQSVAKYINLFVGDGAFIEGAFLNKINGRYYFQYATPGTEFPTYGDAVLISDNQLGKFEWQKHNPYSIVPSGFTCGAGHGSTFSDKSGNLWHASTVCVGVNHNLNAVSVFGLRELTKTDYCSATSILRTIQRTSLTENLTR